MLCLFSYIPILTSSVDLCNSDDRYVLGFTENIFLTFGEDDDKSITFYRTWNGFRYFWQEGQFYSTADNFISPTIRIPDGFPIGDNFYYSLYVSILHVTV